MKIEKFLKEVSNHARTKLEVRFWKKVTKTDGCWLWQATKNQQGYGMFFVGNTQAGRINSVATRVSWELLYGPISDGQLCCHKCDTPSCVRPDHLFLGSHSDNSNDMVAKGRDPKWKLKNTLCPQGHPYSGENLKMSRGARSCAECHRTKERSRYQSKKLLT